MEDLPQPSINRQRDDEPEIYPLDEHMRWIIGEINKAIRDLQTQANNLMAQRQGALVLYCRQHKLEGNWQVAPNECDLVRQAQPNPVAN